MRKRKTKIVDGIEFALEDCYIKNCGAWVSYWKATAFGLEILVDNAIPRLSDKDFRAEIQIAKEIAGIISK